MFRQLNVWNDSHRILNYGFDEPRLKHAELNINYPKPSNHLLGDTSL